MTMTLVETIEVGSGGAASIEFTNIPQTGVDLLLLVSARTNADNQWLYIGINGSIQSFNSRDLFATGSAVSSNTRTDSIVQTMSNLNSWTANTFSNVSLHIPNYAGSATKTMSFDAVTENNASTAYSAIKSLLWNSTSAITSLSLNAESATTLTQNTSASLYIIS